MDTKAKTRLVDAYCAVWSEPDQYMRAERLHEVWAVGATYTDPTVHAVGLVELLAHIDSLLRRRPETRVVRIGEVDSHHNCLKFHWTAGLADGPTFLNGVNFAQFSTEGKLLSIIGFFATWRVLTRGFSL